MRRVLVVVVGASLVLSWASSALAIKPHHERDQTRWVNAFWNSRKNVDLDAYLRVTWYAGAYESQEYGFFSDLYRSVERCQRRAGRDRCRYQRHQSWYGYTTRLGQNSFTLNKRLTTGHLDASYRLYRTVQHHRVLVGRFHVVADLSGTGQITHGREGYSSHQGCTTVDHSGNFKYRMPPRRGRSPGADRLRATWDQRAMRTSGRTRASRSSTVAESTSCPGRPPDDWGSLGSPAPSNGGLHTPYEKKRGVARLPLP